MLALHDAANCDADESKMIAEAVANVVLVFKSKTATAKIPASLASYIKTIQGKYPTTKTATGWSWTGANPTRATEVGDVWVVIEAPANNDGIWASIFTDHWQ